jgi:AraC-like DNA-binding protein
MKSGSKGFKDWILEEDLPGTLYINEGGIRKSLVAETPAGKLKCQCGSFGGIVWSHVMFNGETPFSCTCQGAGKSVTMIFHLSGTLEYAHLGHVLSLEGGQHNICFTPVYNTRIELHPADGVVQTLMIDLPVDYYTNLLSGYSETQQRFIKRIAAGDAAWLQEKFMSMTMPMKWIIHSVRQNQRTGILKRLFLEAKTLELLMLQAEQAELRLNPVDAKSRQREALYEARAILERNLDHAPTIKTLARMVGLNEFALKKGFKDTFQETIYGYVSKLKMQQARQMLLDGNKSINEVSALAGYKNPQHFTTAFKKYFGVLPSKLKA